MMPMLLQHCQFCEFYIRTFITSDPVNVCCRVSITVTPCPNITAGKLCNLPNALLFLHAITVNCLWVSFDSQHLLFLSCSLFFLCTVTTFCLQTSFVPQQSIFFVLHAFFLLQWAQFPNNLSRVLSKRNTLRCNQTFLLQFDFFVLNFSFWPVVVYFCSLNVMFEWKFLGHHTN